MLFTKQKVCSICGRESKLWRSHPPTCAFCIKKEPVKVNRTKLSKEITINKEYYSEAIQDNINKYGSCTCENCYKNIPNPKGRNVSHIIAKGTNKSLYLEKDNNFVLCLECEDTWTNGDRKKMRIFPESQTRKFNLLNNFYLNPNQG